VAVTTTLDRIGPAVGAVRAAGLDPVMLPCVAVEAAPHHVRAGVARRACAAEALVVTSARAVEILWPRGAMPGVPAAVVGASTAAAVRAAGGRVAVVGDGGLEVLLSQASHLLAGRTVVYPHSARTGGDALAALRGACGRLVAAVVYDTRSVKPDASVSVDVAMFASPSAVHGWLAARPLAPVARVAIGPTTAAALAGVGYAADAVASHPSYPALAAAARLVVVGKVA
jgi:uroporphyrinogen-III synthase